MGSIMPQIEIEPVKCRLGKMSAGGASGASCQEFCLYEFPGCAGCPYAFRENPGPHSADDPMKSAVLRGWILGISQISKYAFRRKHKKSINGTVRSSADY